MLLAGAILMVGAACASRPAAGYAQSHSAGQIVADATTSSGAARSYHLTLAEATADGPARLDLDVEDGNASGTIRWASVSLRIIYAGGVTFIYGSDLAGLLAPVDSDAATMIKAAAADRWVLVPPSFWHSTLTQLIGMNNLGGCLRTASGLAKKGVATVAGRLAVEVDDGTASKLYVDTAMPHYLVHADIAGADACVTSSTARSQVFDWSDYGARFNIATPAGYLDLRTIG